MRIMLAALASGSGKTTISCGMLAALKNRGMKIGAMKCGPDYIDPMFHRKVLGVPSGNLDSYFTDENTVRYLLSKKENEYELTLLEGVMGYYDGLGGTSTKGSSYELASMTDTPVVLVVDCKGASVTLAALVRGMQEFKSDSHICGVILNRVSESFYPRIKTLIEEECKLPVLGGIPNMKDFSVPSRHLGLVSPEELEDMNAWVMATRKMVEDYVDIDAFLDIAKKADALKVATPEWKNRTVGKEVKIAVARDEAFSFYYEENLELLETLGARLVAFSPLKDKKLPEDVDGILLGGGYPELYAKELSENVSMRDSIRVALERELPCLAECGGFLYLQHDIQTKDNLTYPMVGFIDGNSFPTGKLCRFGYATLTSKRKGLFGNNCEIKGHEFHYWDSTNNGDGFVAKQSSRTQDCMVYTDKLAAGFPHLYYYSNPEAIMQFVETCRNYSNAR